MSCRFDCRMNAALVESPVDLHEDPGVDLVVEPLVDGLVDLIVDSVDSTEIG